MINECEKKTIWSLWNFSFRHLAAVVLCMRCDHSNPGHPGATKTLHKRQPGCIAKSALVQRFRCTIILIGLFITFSLEVSLLYLPRQAIATMLRKLWQKVQ
jgi:hypothetical protein